MTAKQNARSAILILGMRPRSGTNFLFDLLVRHPRTASASPFMEDFLLYGGDHLQRYVEQVSARWDGGWGVTTQDGDELLQRLGTAALAFLERRVQDPGKRLLSKTPNVGNLELFFKLFPTAKPVVLVRDGRAVVESAMKTFDTTLELQASEWDRAAKTILSFRQYAAPETYRVLRYEDLVTDTEAQLRALLEFLELDPADYPFEALDSVPVRGSSEIGRRGGTVHWDPVDRPDDFNPLARFAHWSDTEHQAFNGLAGDSLRALGYRTKDVAAAADRTTVAATAGADAAAAEPLFCSVDFEHFWNDPQLAFVSSLDDERRCLMPHQAISVLSVMDQFQNLDHWSSTLSALGMPLSQARDLQQEFRAGGLLVSARELLDTLHKLEPAEAGLQHTVQFMVIRTCERPELLKRLLQSAAVNLRKHRLTTLILDDSRTESAQGENARAAARFGQAAGLELIYVGASAQRHILQELCSAFPEHAATIEYGLAPRPAGVFTAGRLINLANLLLAGRPYLIFDDDYLLDQQLIHPEVDLHAAVLTSAPECAMEGYDSREAMLRSLHTIGTDPFAEHLDMLGRSLGSLMQSGPFAAMGEAGLSALSSDAVTRLSAATRVLTTGNGAVGRPIAPSARAGLDQTYRRTRPVWQQPKSYDAWRRGHFIYKSHHARTLQNLTFETPVAVDNSQLMPPTIPSGRREDTLFTLLVQHIHGAALHLELPWAIEHWREARDWSSATLDQPESLSLALLMTEAMLPETRATGSGQAPAQVLQSIGALCRQFAGSGRSGVQRLVLRRFRTGLSSRLHALEDRLVKLPADALAVKRDIERIIAVNRKTLQAVAKTPVWEDAHAPAQPSRQLDWVAEELSGMGQLMQLWPDLWTYCRDHQESILLGLTGDAQR